EALPPLVANTALFAVGTAAGISWLATSPFRTALDWLWSSYAQLVAMSEQMRDRQGELGRLSKSLTEACVRLEQMNRELDRARQAAEEARRLKAEFAATISHELRTPLNLIIGFSELMVVSPGSAYGSGLPESYRGDVEAIYRNACQVSSLIDDILDLSQIDAHRMALQKDAVSLPRIVDEATASVGTLFEQEGLSLTVNLSPELPLLHADPTRVRQVLINLLTNALRYTDTGGVAIGAERDGGEVVVSVTDTGVGISSADLPRVFHEFQQFGSGRRRGRSGLGLTVSKRFVEMHGGSMWVTSTPGKGSTFSFSLPVSEGVVATATGRNWRLPADDPRTRRKHSVVVLDEDNEVARVFCRYLDDYEVIGATRSDQARQMLSEGSARAIVVGSPRMAAEWRRLVEAQPELRSLPTLSCALRTRREIAQDLRVAGYLAKPVTREQVRTALRQLGRPINRLLIVDDDPEMVSLLARMSRSLFRRCQVHRAHGGEECLRLMRESRPDVVLLDLIMPDVDGYTVLEAMRDDASLTDIPVVVVSAKRPGDDAVVIRHFEVSRDSGLSVAELMDCVKGCLDGLLTYSGPRSNDQGHSAAAVS
ncbi:MAG: response regulator, partial [Chloroflexi bacterium]|nr:response regulator [Chloroflexota bacterium]